MPRFSLDQRAVRGRDHVETHVEGQTLMMSLDKGRYFALEATGQRVWEMIAEPIAVSEIVDRLLEEYDVERAACEAQVLAFLDDLAGNGLATAAQS